MMLYAQKRKQCRYTINFYIIHVRNLTYINSKRLLILLYFSFYEHDDEL